MRLNPKTKNFIYHNRLRTSFYYCLLARAVSVRITINSRTALSKYTILGTSSPCGVAEGHPVYPAPILYKSSEMIPRRF